MAENGWSVLAPVPQGTPLPPGEHPTLGQPTQIWTYRSDEGDVLGYVCRFDRPDGKIFQPLTFGHDSRACAEWRWRAWPTPRPLYGLDRLAQRPDAPVVVCEGEKAADAAGELLPDHVAVSASNGANGAAKADWRPLTGRRVIIWPDADEAGRRYAQAVARAVTRVGASGIVLIEPPSGSPSGWDAADALLEKWDSAQVRALIQAGSSSDTIARQERSSHRRSQRPAQRDQLAKLADELELWHSPQREPFASVLVDDHLENWPVRSKSLNNWLAGAYFDTTGNVPGAQALDDSLRVLEMKALRGPQHRLHLRIGGYNGSVYLDLGDRDWRVAEITPNGWKVIERSPLKFIRSRHMEALPEPEAGISIDALRPFVNVASEADFSLMVGFLVGAFRPDGPFAILLISGEQGSAKSTAARVMSRLLDPRVAALRSLPREERDLAIAADNGRVLAFDNVSRIPDWLSDALCRLATGGGFATRELHSNRDEVVFEAQRPIILNGIPDLASRPDLGDRAVSVTLASIPHQIRRAESDFWREFEAVRPQILGALLDAVSSSLRHLNSVPRTGHERMADFSIWVTAAEPGLGWDQGSFMGAYRANRQGAVELAVENDPVAAAVRTFAETLTEPFEKSASELLPLIEQVVPERVRASRTWPSTPAVLSNRLRRAAPALRQVGIEVQIGGRAPTKDRKRLIMIKGRA